MALRYRCPSCAVKLTLVNPPEPRFECPGCERLVALVPLDDATAALPRAVPPPRPQSLPYEVVEDDDVPEPERPSIWADKRVQVGVIAGGLMLMVGVLVVVLLATQKSPDVEQVQNAPGPTPSPSTQVIVVEPPPGSSMPIPVPAPAKPPSGGPSTPPAIPPKVTPPPSPPPMPPVVPPKVKPPPLPTVEIPPKIEPPPRPKIDYSKLDQFGNPIDQNAGLAQQGEFKGQRILFWSPHTGAGNLFFAPKNPLWKALEEKGFVVRREFGRFNAAWLKDTDQLWILSTAPEEFLRTMRATLPDIATLRRTLKGLPPDLLDSLIKDSAAGFPREWTTDDVIEMTLADTAMAVSPSFHLTARDYDAIVAFVKSGKGLLLLADNDPHTTEASELGRRLFGVTLSGNYKGTRIAYVRQRGLKPDEVRKFKGDYAVDDHPLLTNVNFVYEGITISTVKGDWEGKLDVALRASDGSPVVLVSKVPGLRVVIDCGFTRYCHGPSDRVSFICMTAGTTRLAQNIAALLAGKTDAKGP